VSSVLCVVITVRPIQGGPPASSHSTEVPSKARIVFASMCPKLLAGPGKKLWEDNGVEVDCLDGPIDDKFDDTVILKLNGEAERFCAMAVVYER
jgi:hypothetical protein